MADPVSTAVLVGLGIVVLRRAPQTPQNNLPPATLPPDTQGSPLVESGQDSLGLGKGALGAALAGAVVGYQVIKSLDGKAFNNSGENRTTSTLAPWVGAAGGAVAGIAVYSAIVGSISIPVAGQVVVVAAVIVLAVISIADAIESTINNARKLELYNQVYAKCAVDPRGAWKIAQDAYTKEGFTGLGFKVGIWALHDTESVFDANGEAFNVKETLVAAYCKSRATGDAFAEICAQAMPWFGYMNAPFKATCSDSALNDIRSMTKDMKASSELGVLFNELYAGNAGRLSPAKMSRSPDYWRTPPKQIEYTDLGDQRGGATKV